MNASAARVETEAERLLSYMYFIRAKQGITPRTKRPVKPQKDPAIHEGPCGVVYRGDQEIFCNVISGEIGGTRSNTPTGTIVGGWDRCPLGIPHAYEDR